MVAVLEEVRRVLRKDGVAFVNLGDSYNGSGPSGGPGKQYTNVGSQATTVKNISGLKPKDLIGMPWRLAFALRDAGWYLRQDIIWHKPSPMPESVRDRCTKAHEYVFLLSKSPRYYFDAEAIAEPVTGNAHARGSGVNPKSRWKIPDGWDTTTGEGGHGSFHKDGRESGRVRPKQNESFSAAVNELVSIRNKRSVWTVASKPYPAAHFATFPPKLIEPMILAGCPEGGTVLDPFIGSGTTAEVARKLGRRCIGIELNAEYLAHCERRLEQGRLF